MENIETILEEAKKYTESAESDLKSKDYHNAIDNLIEVIKYQQKALDILDRDKVRLMTGTEALCLNIT